MQVSFRVRAMDRYLNLVRLPQSDSEAVGPKGFQAMLLGPGNNEQVIFKSTELRACITKIIL